MEIRLERKFVHFDVSSVSEYDLNVIFQFEAKEDQNKQLVLRCPVGPPAVIYREDSVPPLYEKVLATQETRTVRQREQMFNTKLKSNNRVLVAYTV